jgi:hypothetical protein
VSLMTSNDASAAWSGAKQRALDTYAQLAPAARNAYAQLVPVARNAGLTCRQGADVVVAWANPRVRGARVWAAPRVEQAGFAVRDQIGPAVSAALIEAAHRLDDPPPPPPPRRSRWPWVLAGIGLLAAAGSAAAAIMLKRRPESETFGAEDEMTADSAAPSTDTDAGYPQPSGEADRSQGNGGVDVEESAANGRMRTP